MAFEILIHVFYVLICTCTWCMYHMQRPIKTHHFNCTEHRVYVPVTQYFVIKNIQAFLGKHTTIEDLPYLHLCKSIGLAVHTTVGRIDNLEKQRLLLC